MPSSPSPLPSPAFQSLHPRSGAACGPGTHAARPRGDDAVLRPAWVVAAVGAVHLAGLWALMSHAPDPTEMLPAPTWLQVDFIAVAPPPPTAAMPPATPPAPRPRHALAPPPGRPPSPVIAAPPSPAPAAFTAAQPTVEAAAAPDPATTASTPAPSAAAPVPAASMPAVASPPAPPAPAAAPKLIPASAVAYRVPPPIAVPLVSRRLGESGTVLLRVRVGRDGLPQQVSLHRTSGFDRLDQQALDAMRSARFEPQTRDGQAIEWQVIAPLQYDLE